MTRLPPISLSHPTFSPSPLSPHPVLHPSHPSSRAHTLSYSLSIAHALASLLGRSVQCHVLWVCMCVFLSLESLAQTEDIIARKFKVSKFLCVRPRFSMFFHLDVCGVSVSLCVCVLACVCVCVCVCVRWGSGWWWSPYMTRPWIRGGSDQMNVFNWACSSKNSSRKVLTDPRATSVTRARTQIDKGQCEPG
jgi:hypothetical protein